MKTTLSTLAWLAAALAAAGCAQTPGLQPRHDSVAGQNGSVVSQVGYGRSARYVTCPLSECGRPTPKTIASAEPVAEATAPSAPQMPAAPLLASAASSVQMAAAPVPERVAEVAAPQVRAEAPAAALPRPAAVDPEFVQAQSSSGRERVFIGFPSGSARLTKEAKAKLSELAPRVLGAERVVIKGRTDERGSADSNDRLALRRAMAVYDFLRRSAKAHDKPFQLLAKGACCYVARNITEDGRAANRRAEIDFVTPMQASVRSVQPTPGKGKPS